VLAIAAVPCCGRCPNGGRWAYGQTRRWPISYRPECRAFVEVGGVEVAFAVDGGAGEAGVAGSVGGLYHHHGVRGRRRGAAGYFDGQVPSGDGGVNGGEKKIRGRACGQEEIRGAAIGDGARGSPRGEGLAGGDDNVAPELVERSRRENIQVLCV
jgi:hypothetical protein